MTTAAPFPEYAETPHRRGRVTLIPERNEYVPPWYVPHKDPKQIIVKQNGQPLAGGFTVAEMLPERRWAVGPDGELISQLEFQEKYQRKLVEYYHYASVEAQQGRGKIPSSFSVHREVIPNVAHYVVWRADPRDARRTLEIGYNPNATSGTRSKRLWVSDGDDDGHFAEGNERMALLVEAYRDEQLRGKLKSWELEEVEAHLSGTKTLPAVANQVQAKLQTLTDLRASGTIDDASYSREVAKLFGHDLAGKEAVVPRGQTKMTCGTLVMNMNRKHHVKSCEVCGREAKASA